LLGDSATPGKATGRLIQTSMDRGEEQQLIRKAAQGSKAAIESLVRAHQSSLYGFVYRLTGRPEVAEDVVQESFVRVIMNIQRFDSRFRFSTWLFTIARRLYINSVQKSSPGFDTDAVERSTGASAGGDKRVADLDEQSDRRDRLEMALSVLSPDQREIFLLFHQHDWPIKVIAEHMQIPEGTVKSHLHRSRRAVRDAMVALGNGTSNDSESSGNDSVTRTFAPEGGGDSQQARQDPVSRDARSTPVVKFVRTEVSL
jgi:RNA polymerase sigma-70 factor (ECF subfamily)